VKILDLFCGAGGAAVGYEMAGFEVIGVDHVDQPNYPYDFIRGDALTVLSLMDLRAGEYDAIHASPPCQTYANVTAWRGNQDNHPDLLPPTREALKATGLPWVIENVPEAPLRPDLLLCGSQFGLRVRRHRAFETSWRAYSLLPPCHHRGLLPFIHKGERAYADALGCEWMTKLEARQAIPPAFTHHVGEQLAQHIATLTIPDPPTSPRRDT
jgi:DNA (cytosine-5)-methyltransferase 1